MPFNFCCIQELPLRRIENRPLCDGICQCRRRSFDAERISIGPSETRTDEYRRQVVVAEFAVRGKGALDVGSRDRRSRAVGEREPNGALERQRFRLAARCNHHYGREQRKQNCKTTKSPQTEVTHCTL